MKRWLWAGIDPRSSSDRSNYLTMTTWETMWMLNREIIIKNLPRENRVYHSTVLSMNEKCDFFLLWLVHLISLIYLITSNAWMTKLMIWSNSWLIFRTFRTYVLSFEDSLKTFVSILERQNVSNHWSTRWLNVFISILVRLQLKDFWYKLDCTRDVEVMGLIQDSSISFLMRTCPYKLRNS